MKTFKDYHVLQLTDVFRDHIKFCKDNYGLNPLNYVTFPELAKDACLKVSGVSLDPVIDLDLRIAIQQCVRGGISMAVKRVSRANNKYMKNYDPSKPDIFLLYFDANNLYDGDAMNQKLPTGNYRRIREHIIETAVEDKLWRNIPGFSKVDIIIPEHLHDYFNDLPSCPERRKINGVDKLVTTLDNKYGYWYHHEAITLWEDMGCIITKYHEGFTFDESRWMKPYSDLNTELRKKAKSESIRDQCKLANNSVFGKTVENPLKRVNYKFVTDRETALKLIANPNFINHVEFTEEFHALHMRQQKVVWDKPTPVGAAILALSKVRMYRFFYFYVKPKWGDKVSLVYTDTDSFILELKTPDAYKDIEPDLHEWFDTRKFAKDNPYGFDITINNDIPGKFKDEFGGKIIYEGIALASKL